MDKRRTNDIGNALIMVLQLGLNVIVPIFLCMIAGGLLAKLFDVDSDGFLIGGMLIGIVAAFNGAYRSFKKYLKNQESPGQRARRLEEEAKQGQKIKND
ncbi:AtpZ/AtpI family protein [Pseudobutyrivibrio sp.]|uniref:AtpZ/AtpI family protein n=1 Tax=Pseudobutyrivibrio sp. TaxID=2014367 RepID=UPI0025EFD3B7|nr:AtpZ/AtpI family protein [Pseudobutyrivibrio sp.]